MAENYGILVCLIIMALDVVAGILGIEAEIAQNKVKHSRMWIFECRDPSYQAFKLGLAAILFLPLAQIIANLLGGCASLWSTEEDFGKASAAKKLAAASLFISWIVLAIGFTMLTIGNNGKLKINKIMWIIASSHAVHRRHSVFHSWNLRSRLLCICHCLNRRRCPSLASFPISVHFI
ncbi:hypothetical protein OIU74_003072 [Salix koriyanagi]|uniref:Uncharacterized protein n=1 Tax=Salix koriyanagi TaxID=2511006 RepID=A0A9Q0UXW8_9ROSI|nr:hypothetical protein OIU74_003072 [Salix koriyanagi]